jgi:pectinesterase
MAAYTQQTSTDTTWKIKYWQQNKIPPQWPVSLTVAKDGSGDYKAIQDAVNAVRDLSQDKVIIHIKNGVYNEKLVIPAWKTKVSLVGESKDSTIITNSDFSGKDYPGGKDLFGRAKFSTYTSYTVLVQGDDFSVQNLTIENRAGKVGQAVALHVEGDRFMATNIKLLGNQDTLYAATAGSRQYYKDCYIEGTTDFIFGEATAVFQSCTIKSLANSYVTAAATNKTQKFGYVFFDCSLVADTAATKVFLGRPWRPHAKTVFIRTYMGAHIVAAGWDNWRNPANERTVEYAEYKSTGPGRSTARAAWSKQLSEKEVKRISLQNIFSGGRDWIPNNN